MPCVKLSSPGLTDVEDCLFSMSLKSNNRLPALNGLRLVVNSKQIIKFLSTSTKTEKSPSGLAYFECHLSVISSSLGGSKFCHRRPTLVRTKTIFCSRYYFNTFIFVKISLCTPLSVARLIPNRTLSPIQTR